MTIILKPILQSTVGYTLIIGLTIATGLYLWGRFSTPAYQIVTLFMALIIISNSMAKLSIIYISH